MGGKIKSFFERWKSDYAFKTIISAGLSLGITILFALYNGYLGLRLLSVWHGSICVFYLFLAAIRGIILLTEKRNAARAEDEKARRTRRAFIVSAVMLLGLNLALILPISLMVIFEKPLNMGMVPAIAMAAYTTYKVVMASVHLRKQKRKGHNNVLISELRMIHFVDALVSILTLQNTLIMVMQDGAGAGSMFRLSAVSSAVIYAGIVCITVSLLRTGLKGMKA